LKEQFMMEPLQNSIPLFGVVWSFAAWPRVTLSLLSSPGRKNFSFQNGWLNLLWNPNWMKLNWMSWRYYLKLIACPYSISSCPHFMALYASKFACLSLCLFVLITRILLAINRNYSRNDSKWQNHRLSKLLIHPEVRIFRLFTFSSFLELCATNWLSLHEWSLLCI
jgi:hypothetical protein